MKIVGSDLLRFINQFCQKMVVLGLVLNVLKLQCVLVHVPLRVVILNHRKFVNYSYLALLDFSTVLTGERMCVANW